MQEFTNIGVVLQASMLDLWRDVVGIIPEILSAIIVLIIGLIVAGILGRLAARITKFLKVDEFSEKLGVNEQLKSVGLSFTFSHVIGKIVKIFFIIVFLTAAVEILGMTQITLFLNDVLAYLPNVVVALAIMAIGLIVGRFVKDVATKMLSASQLPIKKPELLGSIAMWVVVVFAAMASLIQLNIASEMIQILFTAIVFALALAFGLGGKDHARKALDAIFEQQRK